MTKIKELIGTVCFILITCIALAQTGKIKGKVTQRDHEDVQAATVSIPKLKKSVKSTISGAYELTDIPYGTWELEVRFVGFHTLKKMITLNSDSLEQHIELSEKSNTDLDEVVVSGTMKEVSKLESSVPVEVYTSKFFKANPTPSLFDALQNINGVRPQLNCNVCSTGDIHINGLEGPYTMILIDGMPIVSGLSTVYGLSGIPQSLIDRVEIVKGPASTLYGSEAVGGLINIITKRPENAPLLSLDAFGTTWGEISADVAAKFNVGKKAQSLLGINYFNYQHPIDNNNDNFTDITLQHRISIFNKWNFERKDNRIFSLAGRYVYEDRWGGEMNWGKKYRGGDEVYGESIYTSRWEFFGTYQLPIKEKILFQFSTNGHNQNSVYGNIPYLADQYIGFGQFTWFKTLGRHDLLTGLTYRYTNYDDNTPATASAGNIALNKPTQTHLPGLFLQDEITLNGNNKLLLGVRYDYNSIHGSILTPRLNYKWNSVDKNNVLRLSIGNGYRVANVFTEDHAALTGAREVVFMHALKPETSWNGNINFVKKIDAGTTFIGLDATAFYTYFTNKIIPNYDKDPNKIIYDNINGHAVSSGVSLNIDVVFANGLKILAGATAMDVYNTEEGKRSGQMFTEKFTAVWNIGYTFKGIGLTADYTGNLYGPMRLPLLSATDPRREYSPWWSIQNIQLTKHLGKKIEIYGGVKNLLNWTPNKGNPFIIARTNDPFDKKVQFGTDGQAMVTADNPYGLTFDPSYVYGPNQGIRGFLGFRYHLFK
ncbi:TonB-dependent receptor [Sphingobacterium sp. SRCM116780]|uniref:TonB-dependent receptor n=1 Tax=Sphingobacterium sp. SRCM116780 TaxID=2907623 RepID=UPI001F20BF60|nr:TonB-dependent receptor [Sphingobacterium sp. SRCM116780]UIR56832.1 TonB-dependent receptor [Sphingobacterium sp. SRCM116780]